MNSVEAPNCVTIFGAGIAGLTAAHELVERGFRVQVWEPADDQRYPWDGCDVGGMARTQWSRIHWPEGRDLGDPWPRIQPLLQELRLLVDNGGSQWVGLTRRNTGFTNAQDVWDDLLDAIADDDGEAVVDAVVYESGVAPPAGSAVQRTLDLFLLLTGGVLDGQAIRVGRDGQGDVLIRVLYRKDSTWMSDASEAALRVELYHIPPWGTRTAPIVHLPQKFYVHRTDDAPDARPDPPEKDCPGGKRPRRRRCKGCGEPPEEGTKPAFTSPEVHEDGVVREVPAKECTRYCMTALGALGSDDPGAVVSETVDALLSNPHIRHVYVEIADRRWAERCDCCGPWSDPGWDLHLASCLRQEFQRLLDQVGVGGDVSQFPWNLSEIVHDPRRRELRLGLRLASGRLVEFTVVRLRELPLELDDCIDMVMRFRVRERWLPGEHGYRFFPSFYHHLFDTMERTPILQPVAKSPVAFEQEWAMGVEPDTRKYSESFRVARDNLLSQMFTVLAFADKRSPARVRRRWFRSISEGVEAYRHLVSPPGAGGLGFTTVDWVRLNLRFLQFLTSSEARRADYEERSWWDFIDADTFTQSAQAATRRFPKALVAIDAVDGDARTIGTSGVQTFLDQFGEGEFRDGTLRGPTSVAWLKYWRRYLEAQGVEFVHGRLCGLTTSVVADTFGVPRLDEDGNPITRVWPVVECYDPLHPFEHRNTAHGCMRVPFLLPGYFVLALPADAIRDLASRFCEDVSGDARFRHRDLERAACLELGDPGDVDPDGEFQHFAGVQFYFEEDVYWVDGHVYYPDSPWAVTSISQVRFWEDKHDWEHGYRGVLSAIVGRWDVPGETVKKPAWECNPEELAKELWSQIRSAVESREDPCVVGGILPRPLFWHLDDSMEWHPHDPDDVTAGGHWVNHSPFQIETPGRYKLRPGDLGSDGYSSELGVVLAGTYMKTHTRITSMEAANESGRHAANAILRDLGSPYRRTPCDIWPPDEREVRDFDFLKEIDEELHRQGLPHAMEIMGIDWLAAELGRLDGCDPTSPLSVLPRLQQIFEDWRRTPGWPHCKP